MSVVPLRNVVLTAASVDWEDIFATIYADMLANSTWLLTNEFGSTGPPGPDGGFSFTAQSPDGTIELNFLNDGTQGSPSLTDFRIGVNPDGSADPITDSRNPSASAANFSGADDGKLQSYTPANTEFILIEWDHAIMVLFKDAGRTATPLGIYLGECLLQPITALESSGAVRLDGTVVFGAIPDKTASGWASVVGTTGADMRRRIGTGQTIDTVGPGITASWSEPSLAGFRLYDYFNVTIDSYFQYGPSLERVAMPVSYGLQAGSPQGADQGWISRHLRTVPGTLPPYSMWTAGGTIQYMVIGSTPANSGLAIVIKSPFNPNP